MKEEGGAIRIIPTTGRNNCGGRCMIYAHVQDGKVVKLTTQTAPETPGEVPLTACPRGMNYHKTFLGPDRLKYPMLRTGRRGEGRFARISWDEAIDRIASEWVRIRDAYGPSSRYVNYGTGVSALLHPGRLAKRLLSLDGGYLDYYNSYSSACARQAASLMYGRSICGSDPVTWLDSRMIILWGHNPAETHFDCTSMYHLRKAREKGIPIVAVDPRQSDTIRALKAQWIALRPDTDAALADAMAYVIWTEGLADKEFLDRCCIGFDREHMPEGVDPTGCVLDYLLGTVDNTPKTPEWASRITGVPAETIRSLAVAYASAKPAAILEGYGGQRNACGEQCTRGTILLSCMTGNVGRRGGGAAGPLGYRAHRLPAFPSLPNPCRASIPCFCWTDAVDHGHLMGEIDGVKGVERLDSDIRMILNLAGNSLINQHSDINRTAEILRDESKCQFILCSDVFMTASARFADILLPAPSFFECENITSAWEMGDFIGYNNKVIEPLYECRFEYDWLCDVADRLGLREPFSRGLTAEQWLRRCYDESRAAEPQMPEFDEFKKTALFRFRDEKPHIAFEENCRDPQAHPFPTESGKIELFSRRVLSMKFRDPFPPIPRYMPGPEGPDDPLREKYPLQLMGWHTKRRCHSIHDNNKEMHALDPQALWMNEADASPRGLKDGDLAEVWNDRGRMIIPVKVTDRLCPGVTALSQGAWYAPDSGGTDRGGCINILTSLRPTPYARGNPQHTNLVQVKKADPARS